MGQLNLYRIDSQKQEEFEAVIVEKYKPVGTQQTINMVVNDQEIEFRLSFYIDIPYGENSVEWNWLLNFFGNSGVTTRSNPKGILVIKVGEEVYACTYGFSFFLVDKYCDTDFAFDFARRVKYSEVKTTTLLSPGSKRNKVVNTYLDYNYLEFDSGESFAKLKVKADLPEDFMLFEPGIEAGNSIKFLIPKDTISSILDILNYINNKLRSRKIIYRIPVFNKVTDKEAIINLNQRLSDRLDVNSLLVNFSELDIIGVTEIFNNNDSSFEIKYGRNSINIPQLSSEVITKFIQEQGLSLYEGLEKVRITSFNNGIKVKTDNLYNLIDYIDDELRCVLSKGKWYYFNDDYLGYLAASIAEIDVIYDPQYDYNNNLYEQFIIRKYNEEKNNSEYEGLEQDVLLDKLRKKYYRERVYNLYMEENFGFECHDREEVSINGSKIELMDLYKYESLFAVKIGNSSSVLCYAIDQSISTLKLYKQHMLEFAPITKKFGVWLLLDRRKHLRIVDGKPDINQLKMLSLKNKLDSWKKEVRVLGYAPVIMINYFN